MYTGTITRVAPFPPQNGTTPVITLKLYHFVNYYSITDSTIKELAKYK